MPGGHGIRGGQSLAVVLLVQGQRERQVLWPQHRRVQTPGREDGVQYRRRGWKLVAGPKETAGIPRRTVWPARIDMGHTDDERSDATFSAFAEYMSDPDTDVLLATGDAEKWLITKAGYLTRAHGSREQVPRCAVF